MAIDPMLQRMLVGAGLGALVTSGKGRGIGSVFLTQFLRPLAKNTKAVEFVAKAMYSRENTSTSWELLPSFDKSTWLNRATTAIEAVVKMTAEAAAGAARRGG